MDRFIRIIVLAAIGIVLVSVLIKISPLGKLFGSSSLFGRINLTPSENVLYLTPAIKSFNGKIEKVEKESITVSKEFKVEALANSPTKKITYKVTVTSATKINRMLSTGGPLSIKDLKNGDLVTVLTGSDLRFLQGNQFEASMVNILPKITSLSGTITAVKDNTVTVNGTVNVPPVPELMNRVATTPKNYTVTIDKNTSVVRYSPPSYPGMPTSSAKTDKLTQKDLKVGTGITVEAKSEIILSDKVEAKKISVSSFTPTTASGSANFLP